MERRQVIAILPEEPRVGTILPHRILAAPTSSGGATVDAVEPTAPTREAETATSVTPEEGDATDVRATAPVSDAVLEPLYAAARDRRASYLRADFPIVSAVVFGILVCVAWLV